MAITIKNLSLYLNKGKLFALTITQWVIGLSPIFTRVTSILLLILGLLLFDNILYIQSLGSEIGVYSGLYQVTVLSLNREAEGKEVNSPKIIARSPGEGNIKLNVLTLDLETRTLKNGDFEVISSCIYDGSDYYTFYLTDFIDPDALLEATVDHLINLERGENIEHCVYIHNSSGFDMVFLFSHLINLKSKGYELKIIKRQDKFMSLSIIKNKNEEIKMGEKVINLKVPDFKLTFYDSLLLLPSSLQKLSKSFNVGGKLDFNVLENNNADLSNIDFKEKLLDYNKQDCKILYDVLYLFNENIKNLFEIEIWKIPTLPSLSFRIYKKGFLFDFKIPITTLDIYNEISQGYRGGAVDMYRPYIENGYYYDVNSLYPYVMKINLYPVGETIKFTGHRELSDTFGIVKCKVVAPKIYAPILLTKTADDRIILYF